MHIVVIVKRIDTSNTSDIERVLDITDVMALNQAVFLRDTTTFFNKVSVICIAPPEASQVIRECYALGADFGYMLSDSIFESIDIEGAVAILNAAINKIGDADIVLMGSPSNDEVTISIGHSLAESLRFNHAENVIRFDYHGGRLNVRHLSSNRGTEDKTVTTPVLLNLACDSNDRFRNAMRIMKAFKKEVKIWDASDLNLDQKKLSSGKKRVMK